MDSKLKPMYTQVLLQSVEQSKQSSGGIALIGAPDETTRAHVVAVGHGRRGRDGAIIPLIIKVGNEVLVNTGTIIKVDGEKYILVKEDDILAIVNE